MTPEEAREDGLVQVTQQLSADTMVETVYGSVSAVEWCCREATRFSRAGRYAVVARRAVGRLQLLSVWAARRSGLTSGVRTGGRDDGEASLAAARKGLLDGIDKELRHSSQEFYNAGLHQLLTPVTLMRPCCCVRCRTTVSAERLEQHWVLHTQQIDSIGAPGSTRWCPQTVQAHGIFGMTGLKADPRKKW